MQCTEKYFEADAFRTRAESVLLAAVPDSRTGGGLIALEGTVFYPEGGGQPADRGTLTLPDGTELAVTDVHEQDGILWHSVPSLPDTAVPGITVEEAIDWDWRFDKMQQHTGEHILSGILHRMFGAENVGFHIGAEAVRMDTSVPISAEGLRAAELEANRIVWQDVPVVITYPTPQELAALTYRSKKEIEGQVRIVTIPGADVCACCGTHTRTTGQVGQIKILTSENYKGGVRLSIVCGARALEAAQAMRARQADIGALLSAKADQTAVAVHRVYDEYTALKFNHFGLCSQLFDALAAAVEPGQNAIRIVPGLDPDGLHRLAVRLSEATTGLCAALTPNDKGTGYCLAQAGGDVRALTKALNIALNGRGGGKPGICQGSCAATPEQVEEMKMAAEDFRKVLKSGDVTKIAEADVKFHDIIFAATNNQRLITLLNNLREQMYRFRVEYLKQKECYPQLLEEHDKLIALISGGEVEEACELMGCHIDNQASTVSDVIRRDQVEYHR